MQHKKTLITAEGRGTGNRILTAEAFQALADVPPELEWFANLRSARTRREYADDLRDFQRFVGIKHPEEFRLITRAHVIAWRDDLQHRQLIRVQGIWTPVSEQKFARM